MNQSISKNPFPNVVLGVHDADIVKVDWDDRYFIEVKRFSFILNSYLNSDGFIILHSSTTTHDITNMEGKQAKFKTDNYHSVFNRIVSGDELDRALAWLCLFTKDLKLIEWYLGQKATGTFNLRVGFKGRKHPPKIVYRCGNQDKGIAKFLSEREYILNFLRGDKNEQ